MLTGVTRGAVLEMVLDALSIRSQPADSGSSTWGPGAAIPLMSSDCTSAGAVAGARCEPVG